MTVTLLFAWWNLIYVVPFGLALLYLGLYVFTGLTFGDGDLHLDHDLEMDHDVDVDHDVGVEHDHDASVDSGPSGVMAVLSLLGVGRVPLSLALMILLILWGSIGFALNQLLVTFVGATAMVGVISIPVTGVLSLLLTGVIARVIGKVLPTNETYGRNRSALVGCVGEAISAIDAEFGLVSVRDSHGDLFQVACRTVMGEPLVPKGMRVVLFEYEAEKAVFYVAPFVNSGVVKTR
jgi:membrane protein implicated in regulation of membrane protease activity